MPAHAIPGRPIRRAPFPLQTPYQNGTFPTSNPPPQQTKPRSAEQMETPTAIPTPVYSSVTVLPAAQIEAKTTSTHSEIPKYPGSAATLLQGYCTEPGYTILDGPTAFWVPVVGCISSKADCCPTSTAGGAGAVESPGITGNVKPNGNPSGNPSSNPTGTPGAGGIGGGAGGAAFPISLLPSQGTLTGCPQDYHTVGGTACCPLNYWLWTAQMGGQIPCYSSLKAAMTPPPMPDTLAQNVLGRTTAGGSVIVSALTMSQKPTSAIVNVAYAMQYPMVAPLPKSGMKKEAKIGVGVGVAGAAVFIGLLIIILLRRFRKNKKTGDAFANGSTQQRFGDGVDMSRVDHDPAPLSRTYGGAKYAGVSTRPVNY